MNNEQIQRILDEMRKVLETVDQDVVDAAPPQRKHSPPPRVPFYKIPHARECDVAIMTNGEGPEIVDPTTGDMIIRGGSNPIIRAYRHVAAHREVTRERPVRIALFGDGGTAWLGCSDSPWNSNGADMVRGDIHLVLVGDGDSSKASLRFALGNSWGRVETLHVFNVGLYNGPDSFTIRANKGCGEIILDGHWAEPSETGKTSFIHIDNYQTLVIRNQQDRGAKFREHSGAYIKSAIGSRDNPRHGTWLVDNAMQGGNRTHFSVRPAHGDTDIWQGGDPSTPPQTPIVVTGNSSDGFGFDHAYADGGGVISIWSSPFADVYIHDNTITSARYSAIVVSAQGAVAENQFGNHPGYIRDWYGPGGFPILGVSLSGNVCTAGRNAVQISGVESVWIFDASHEIVLMPDWAIRNHGIDNGTVFVRNPDTLDLKVGISGSSQPVPLSAEQRAALHLI